MSVSSTASSKVRNRHLLALLYADRWALLILPALFFIIIVYLYPVSESLIRAFTHGTEDGPFTNFTWLLSDATQMKILIRTFLAAAAVTGLCLLICYPFTYLLCQVGKKWRALLLAIVVISTWQSIMVRTFAWKIILREQGPLNDVLALLSIGRLDLLGTTTGVLVAMCQVMAPFMILPLYASMRNVDMRRVDAAQSLGASPLGAFFRIYVPLSLPGIVAGSVLVFVVSLGFYVTPAVVGSPQNALLSQAIVLEVERMLNWGHAGAMGLVLLIATALLLLVGWLAAKTRLGVGRRRIAR